MDDFGVPVLATRDASGEFHAFLNACRHRSVKVATEARGQKGIFVCPFHMWSYRNNGQLINVPDEDHFGAIDKECHGLIELPSVERDGLLWVHPSADGTLDIDELLDPELAAELASFGVADQRHVGQKTIDKRLNWKLANDTFGETYHFQKLYNDTLGRLYLGNNLHLNEFGRHHRFVTANHGIDALRDKPEVDWRIEEAWSSRTMPWARCSSSRLRLGCSRSWSSAATSRPYIISTAASEKHSGCLRSRPPPKPSDESLLVALRTFGSVLDPAIGDRHQGRHHGCDRPIRSGAFHHDALGHG